MAKAQPLYTVADQFALLDTDLPSVYNSINLAKYRLLMACSSGGTLDSAKNRFLFLVQDTELRTLFASLLEIPEERSLSGVNTIQGIHGKFEKNYVLKESILSHLAVLGTPSYTIDILDNYFVANEDPVYKLSVMSSAIMMAYIQDDAINNRKE